MKTIILIFIGVILFSCQEENNNFSKLYFYEFYMSPKKMGEINIYIKGDTLFKNRNHYDAFNNRLEYILLTDKEKNTLSNILNVLSNEKLKPYYKKNLTNYYFNWGFILHKKNNESYSSNIMDTINPKKLDKLYSFIRNKVKSPKFTEVYKKNEYRKIKIQNILSLTHESSLDYLSDIKRREMLYMIWHNLSTGKLEDCNQIKKALNFKYEVEFSYLLNATNHKIEKIYLSKDNYLVIKFLNSNDYKCIKLKDVQIFDNVVD
ncbi:hypothetical protein [Mesonia aestuariivivens]|uniref:Lipoprotein n=1 Tax=Mesonia aestuariivivens TaxID=2796128 RepID=A0ABS6W2M1_9FLAO|nr:hypothetical protein [Mesonia aestuariivivens]MBW2962107.1 hypothetical protein [Mesonia aestuariivivens]